VTIRTNIDLVSNKGTVDEWESCVRVCQYLTHADLDLVDPDEKITDREELSITFDYPMSFPLTITFTNIGGFTRLDLFRVIYEGYKYIYNLEEKEVGEEGMLNKAGIFGIWGHHIGGLFIEGVVIDDEGNVDLIMGS